jgi:hypothetical protein
MYAELSYFDGYHFQHIAAWQEAQRLASLRRSTERAIRSLHTTTRRRQNA